MLQKREVVDYPAEMQHSPTDLRHTNSGAPLAKKKTLLQKLAGTGPSLFSNQWLEQYAAICFRPGDRLGDYEVMLITARGSGRWVLPKGGPMKDRTPRQVAAQEAFEEAGVKGKVGKAPLGRYCYVKRLETGESAPCIVEVFSLELGETVSSFKELGQREIRWVKLCEAGRLVEEPELRGIFLALDDRLKSRDDKAR